MVSINQRWDGTDAKHMCNGIEECPSIYNRTPLIQKGAGLGMYTTARYIHFLQTEDVEQDLTEEGVGMQ